MASDQQQERIGQAWAHWCGHLNAGLFDPTDIDGCFCEGCRSEISNPRDDEVVRYTLEEI